MYAARFRKQSFVIVFALRFQSFGNINNSGARIWELRAGPWRQHEPAPFPSSSATCLLALSAVSPQYTSRVLHLPLTRTLDFYLRGTLITPPGFLISCFLSRNALWPAYCGPWAGAHRVHEFIFFSSVQGAMTLKSNKNEPAVILDSVNSVRTALSDLYLEQLLQNKPKSDKVGFFKNIFPTLVLVYMFASGKQKWGTWPLFFPSTISLKIELLLCFYSSA